MAISAPAFGADLCASRVDTGEDCRGRAIPPSSEPTNAEGQAASETPPTETGGAIVVTGSRIRRDKFSTPQNIDVVTRDDPGPGGHAFDQRRHFSPQTVTSGTSQISGSFLGFLSDNGQGANTVGLRGLGASRTLVLLNGRRLAPAGVGAQLVAADLNTLPTSVVQRIEILREGASSIYGSDAIAGVINVITDTEIDGITVDAYADIPEIGAGRTLRGSITAGKIFDRGHIMASFEYREDKGLSIGDRKDTRCQRELAFVNGSRSRSEPSVHPTSCAAIPMHAAGAGVAAGYSLSTFYRGFGDQGRRASPSPDINTGNPDIFAPPIGVATSGLEFNERPESPRASWTRPS